MGVARLLAKAWVVFCLFAGAHAFNFAINRGEAPADAVQSLSVCVLLFGAMGLLFIAGFGASMGSVPRLSHLRLRAPGFYEIVFVGFVAISFFNQVVVASALAENPVVLDVQKALLFFVPGESALAIVLRGCTLDGGRVFAGAFAWLLAIIFVASAVSRVGLTAGLLRLERAMRPSAFDATMLAAIYGGVAIVGFQLLYVGSLYPWLDCTVLATLPGALLIGLAPLMLAYLIVAALAMLRASAPDDRG